MNVQPDLFGGSAIVGASNSVKRVEADQCIGQTDVFGMIGDDRRALDCPDCSGDGIAL